MKSMSSPETRKRYSRAFSGEFVMDTTFQECIAMERIKRKTMGDFLMGLNSVEFIGNTFIDLYFNDFMIVDYLELVENIKFEDIIDRFNSHLKEDNVVLSIIKPLEK